MCTFIFLVAYRLGSVGRRERRGCLGVHRAQGNVGSQHSTVPRSHWRNTRR